MKKLMNSCCGFSEKNFKVHNFFLCSDRADTGEFNIAQLGYCPL